MYTHRLKGNVHLIRCGVVVFSFFDSLASSQQHSPFCAQFLFVKCGFFYFVQWFETLANNLLHYLHMLCNPFYCWISYVNWLGMCCNMWKEIWSRTELIRKHNRIAQKNKWLVFVFAIGMKEPAKNECCFTVVYRLNCCCICTWALNHFVSLIQCH